MQDADTLLELLRGILQERDLWVAVVATLLLGMGALALKLPQRLWRIAFHRTLRIKAIRKRRDPDLQAFLAIYEKRIDEPFRVANDDIITWVEHPAGHSTSREDLTLIAKHDDQPVAILKAIIGRRERLAFVAYLATAVPTGSSDVSPSTIGRQGVAELTSWLSRRLRRRGCAAVVFELTSERGAAKMRLFREYATLHGFRCCRIEMAYLQPKMGTRKRGAEKKMTLTYVGLAKSKETLSCSLDEAVGILNFVYFTVYGETYRVRHNPVESREYNEYLKTLMARQVKQLPGRVSMCVL